MKRKIGNILSLFDGMSCGQIALNRAGIEYDKYFASEIDKWAIKVTQKNYPETIQLGDVKDVRGKDLPKIELLMGGSPCEGFSFSGKQLNFEDPRSKLFFEFVRLLKECKPKYFLLENVRMKKEHENVISKYLGVNPILIDSSLFSAQSRKRLYWTNIFIDGQPKDKGILLRDVLEDFCKEKPFMKQLKHGANSGYERERDKCPTLTTSQWEYNNLVGYPRPGAFRGRYLVDGKRQDGKMKTAGLTSQRLEVRGNGKSNTLTTVQKDNVVVNRCIQVGEADVKGKDCIKRVYSPEGKSPCLTTMGEGHREPKVAVLDSHNSANGLKCVGGLIKNKKWIEDGKNLQRNFSQGKRIYSTDGKSPTLLAQSGGTAGPGNALIVTEDTPEPRIRDKSKCIRLGGRNSKDRHEWDSVDDLHWRKLTPLECERLQTVSDNYTNYVSNSQRYKMLGNGWTVDVIVHIFGGIGQEPVESNYCEQLDLF